MGVTVQAEDARPRNYFEWRRFVSEVDGGCVDVDNQVVVVAFETPFHEPFGIVIMVADEQYLLRAVELPQHLALSPARAEREVAQMVHGVLGCHAVVPPSYHFGVHRVDIRERPLRFPDDPRVPEMGVRGEPDCHIASFELNTEPVVSHARSGACRRVWRKAR